MKKIIKITMIFTTIFLLCGAGVSGISGDKTNTSIDIETAMQVANMKLTQLNKNDFSISNLGEVVSSDENNILFYQFDLNPQGYIVVSACYDLPPVIAYSFTSSFESETEDNVLLQLITYDLNLRYENIPNLPKEVIENRNLAWDSFLNEGPNTFNGRDFQQWPPDGTTPTGGWVETNWHQNAPYNNFCPIDLGSGQKSVAGCPAVAMAQIINYHETVNNVFFDDNDDYYHSYGGNNYKIDDAYLTYDFPSWPQLNTYLDTLTYHYNNQIPLTNDDKAAITYACGSAAKQVYNPSGSGTFGVNQAYKAYLKFNCDSVKLLDESDPYLYPRLSQNMKDALPAHLAVVNPGWTMGHNVVVDGYNTDDYYHINWGWGGTYNGWYLIPDEIPYGLTVVEGIVLDIMNDEGILWADANNVSAATGGTVNFYLDAGKTNQNRNYCIFGGITGTEPGTPLPGGYATLPINWDVITEIIFQNVNTPAFTNFLGKFNINGQATAQLNLPPLPGHGGTSLHFAYCSNNPFNLVSNPVQINIV